MALGLGITEREQPILKLPAEMNMDIISLDKSNIEREHICCAIGADKTNRERAQTKKNWMVSQFPNGLVFKRMNERGKVFIEYMPIEAAWKPIIGKNFMVINCLWVAGKFKGQGYSKELLGECIEDTKKNKMDGVVVVSSIKTKAFLTDKSFYIKHGFEEIDTAPPYFDLLAYRINKAAVLPQFTEKAKKGECENKQGVTIIYSHQCPFMEEYTLVLEKVAEERGVPSRRILLRSCKDAKENGSPFGTLGIYYNGKILTHELMTGDKFKNLLNTVIAG
ncbi:MAG: YoaP domain-containing protein [Sphaerochaetaceae bacterium]